MICTLDNIENLLELDSNSNLIVLEDLSKALYSTV